MREDCAATARLPGGWWVDGERHQEAALRPLVGEDEVFLESTAGTLPLAAWTTAVLGRSLQRLGPWAPVPAQVIRGLCVGDREALMLQVRQLTLGDRLDCVTACPACAQRLDLDLRVSELLVPAYPHHAIRYDTTLSGPDGACHVRFRLVTGEDQETVAATARHDVPAAAATLLRRCVLGVSRNGDPELPVADWPPDLETQLSERINELDAQAEMRLDLRCPECEQAFQAGLDAAACFRRELSGRARDWYQEVHLLAYHYQWSEASILALPPTRRRRYVETLTDALREGSHA